MIHEMLKLRLIIFYYNSWGVARPWVMISIHYGMSVSVIQYRMWMIIPNGMPWLALCDWSRDLDMYEHMHDNGEQYYFVH